MTRAALGLDAGKTSSVGRLILLSALGGVLVAAMVVPVVAATGIVVRNTADKFTHDCRSTPTSLAQRSAIYDRNGKLITYVYGVDQGPGMTYASGIDRQPVAYNQISPNMLDGDRRDRGRPVLAARRARHQGHLPRAGQRPGAQADPGRLHP